MIITDADVKGIGKETASAAEKAVEVRAAATDVVERVRDERSLHKLITLAIPGYRGYRQKEDLRQADALVRQHVGAHVQQASAAAKDARSAATRRLDMAALQPIAEAISELESALAEIEHAEQGYGDKRGAIQVGQEELLALYEYDARLVEQGRDLAEAFAAAALASADDVPRRMAEGRAATIAFRALVRGRREAMLRLGVTG